MQVPEDAIPKLALAAYAVFLLVAFGWRTLRHYRRTGDSGFRGFSGGATARAASVLLLVGLVAAPLAPVLELTAGLAPLPALDRPLLHGAGIAAFLLGLALTVVAQSRMGASWRIGVATDERTALVTDGVFRHVRNPIFTGMLLAVSGLVLLVPNAVAIAAALCALTGLELQVRAIEEPYLFRTHGEAYRAYARSTGRFVPGLGRLR